MTNKGVAFGISIGHTMSAFKWC